VVTRVLKKQEAFPGAHNGRCSDLTVVLSDHGFVSTLRDEPTFLSRPGVAGTHRPEGVFLAMGPGIRSGVRLSPQSIVDMTPTLLYSLGADVPTDLDGQVIGDAFEPAYRQAHPVVQRGTTRLAAAADSDARMEAEDEAAVMSRLRALGYVE
jgi:arylsulfatase A-like enzyme